jgi:hypothetical protein
MFVWMSVEESTNYLNVTQPCVLDYMSVKLNKTGSVRIV